MARMDRRVSSAADLKDDKMASLAEPHLNDSLLQLYPELATENAKQQLYRGHYFSGHNYSIPIGNTFNPPSPIRPGRFTGAA